MNKINKVLVCVILFLLACGVGYVASLTPDARNMTIENAQITFDTPKVNLEIKGEVKNKGIYKVNKGMTVYDALYMAGGVTNKADLANVDTDAIILEDGVLTIPKAEKDSIASHTQFVVSSDGNLGKCNINTAGINQLTQLSGIGESTAKKIIEYRSTHGNFKSIEDILNVKGIGKSKYLKFKDYITVEGK